MSELCIQIRNGVNIKQYANASGFPITRIETIATGVLNREKMGYANITDKAKYVTYQLHNGDILMSHINSHKYVGKCALCTDIAEDEFIIHGMNLLRIITNDLIDSHFLFQYFHTASFKQSIEPYITDAVNQSSINITNLSSIPIPVPSKEEQQRIVTEIEGYESAIAQARAIMDGCAARKQEILKKYL